MKSGFCKICFSLVSLNKQIGKGVTGMTDGFTHCNMKNCISLTNFLLLGGNVGLDNRLKGRYSTLDFDGEFQTKILQMET